MVLSTQGEQSKGRNSDGAETIPIRVLPLRPGMYCIIWCYREQRPVETPGWICRCIIDDADKSDSHTKGETEPVLISHPVL